MKFSTHANRLCSQLLMLGFVLFFNGCSKSTSPETAGNNIVADSIYFGGTIITMNDSQPNAEAVAVKNGKIVAVGARAEVDGAYKGMDTTMIDLAGKTLVPGFIDGHSHFSEVGMQTVLANLLPPPDGTVKNIAELQQAMRDFIATSPVVKTYGIAVGMNYDDSQLTERRHPTRQELDAISTEFGVTRRKTPRVANCRRYWMDILPWVETMCGFCKMMVFTRSMRTLNQALCRLQFVRIMPLT